ncbi:MAG: putative capsid protein [Circoviridae sp.]|nr:MAG: putative capsid protein [Circoviridae sp.]
MPKTKTPRGLNKKEKREVKTLAKSVITSVVEKKYMNTNPAYNVTPLLSKPTSRVSVLAFSNTINTVGSGLQAITLNYGIDGPDPVADAVEMRELKMLRPFTSTTGNQQLDNYAIEGRECMPVSASCKWRLSRDIGKLTSGLDTPDWYDNLGAPNGLQHNLPIICRMVRVTPRLLQTNITCNPEEDLFLNEYNNATGVQISSFDDLELLTYRINKRRYEVIEDKFFRIQNGLTVSYQRSLYADPPSEGSGSGAMLQPFISNTNANCEKVLTTSHRVTQTKGKPVFYDVPDGSALQTATAGAKREYILFHYIYAGAETYLDNVGVTDKAPTDLKLSALPMVKFTDA